ncbi:(2Fe-2S)-binding protein [candidate division WOR-3 bacterium]|nr:(2Fe-2S)-binding protein [candidate division WOR-3 bacterium]
MKKEVNFLLNKKRVNITTDPLRRLLDVLREDLGLKGVKEGCGEGECGSCAVIINNRIVNSCIVAVGTVEGMEIITIEGYRKTKQYKLLEDSFAEAGAVQCGFCTPGIIMAAETLLRINPEPDENAIRDAISGNLCRCTGYNMIIEGIKIASQKGKGLW